MGERTGSEGRSRLEALGEFAARRRRLVLGGALAFVLVAAGVSGNVVDRLASAGFDDPDSESMQAAERLESRFGVDVPKLVLLVRAPRSVDAPAVAAAGRRLARRLAREDGIDRVQSYWTSGPSGRRLRSRDGRSALIVAQVRGDDGAVADRAEALGPEYRGRAGGGATVQVGGLGQLFVDTEERIADDLAKAEAIALPLTLLALILVFRGVVAALLPLAIGVFAIVGTLFALRLLSEVVAVSVFAVNLVTALGLGLAIDYSLFMVARYRAELRAGATRDDALRTTMRTAGRTILYSAVTVAISLAALLVFPMYFLRSFAYAGVSVVAIAAIGAAVLLPALLAAIGPRIDALQLRPRRARSADPDSGFWHRFATIVMRRPLPIATAGIALLLLLGSPFLRASLTYSDDRDLPATTEARQVGDEVRRSFSFQEGSTTFVVADGVRRPAGAEAARYARRLSRIDGVVSVDAAAGTFRRGRRTAPRPPAERASYARGDDTWLAVETKTGIFSERGQELARELRAEPAPFPVRVTGIAARVVDTKDEMSDRLPLALALIVLTTFAALLAMTGSVVAPLKAVILNFLSLTAVFGAMVWVFQEGHLQWLVGDFTVTGTINLLAPPLMFCIAFGLSMDYEVFMLSRIKEEHDRGASNESAIARGLQRTGPIVTAAAALMAIVFTAFSTSGVTNVKMIGLGLTLAVLMDATLVRAALVPAIMRLAGRWNWWAPSFLRRRPVASPARAAK